MTEVIEDGGKDDLVTSERVQVLAQGIYEEFQNLIGLYGPQSITNLMPLVVSVLESFDSSLADNKVHLTALSEVNEENGQLTAQYERERNKRKEAEEKAIQMEVTLDQDNKLLRDQTRKLELDNRDLTAKNRTKREQLDTLEERTELLKREKKELHDRNIELNKSIELLKAARDKRTHGSSSSPSLLKRSPGYQNFAPNVEAVRRRRHLPTTPSLKRAVTCPEVTEGDRVSETNSSPDLLSPSLPPPPLLSTANSSGTSVYREAVNQRDEVLLDGFHGTPVTPTEVATSSEILLEAHGVREHALDEQALGRLQMEQPDIEEEQEVLDSTLESFDDQNDDHETSLFDELKDVGGMEDIITENEQLNTAKVDLVKQLDAVTNLLREANLSIESTKAQLVEMSSEKERAEAQLKDAEHEMKKQKQQMQEMQERGALNGEVSESADGTRITRLEVTRLLRERNEFKEKYLSLLEQIRMSDEISLFKKKERKSRWVDYFTAVFSSNKRKQMEDMLAETSSLRKPLLNGGNEGTEEEDGGHPLPGACGYSKTKTIPTFKRLTRKQEEAYLSSASWTVHDHTHDNGSHGPPSQSLSPNINTCRPVSSLEEGGDILCAAAINPAVYLEDHMSAIRVKKDPPPAFKEGDGTSTCLIWVVTGVPSLTKVSVVDASTVGEVVDTFPVCATPICCVCTVPGFNPNDPEATAGLTTRNKQSSKKQRSSGDGVLSRLATVWMGAVDTGELYVHSAVSNWKRCMHADKLQAGIQAITHLGGKAFVLLKDASLAVFRRFADGEWDWDNYLIVLLCQRKDASVTCFTAAKLSVWCAVGNVVYVINSRTFKMEATITVHSRKKAEVNQMIAIGEGVWMSFKFSSVIKLFHSTAFNHMQDVDVAPPIHKLLSFGSEKRSAQMSIQVSTLLATYSCLWVGTENGIIVTFPFTAPIVIAEESGWEVLKTAEVPGRSIMEPFDIHTEHATEASPEIEEAKPLPPKHVTKPSPNHRPGAVDTGLFAHRGKIFSPFCNVDHMQISIHNHINSVKSLLCVPSMMQMDLSPMGPNQMKPALFIVSLGEGHLDLRTADKIMQALHTKDPVNSGLPSPTSIISEKSYIIVWDLVP